MGTSLDSEQDKSGGVMKYVYSKVNNKKNSKKLPRPSILDSKLERLFDSRIHNSKQSFKKDVKMQKFIIVNALLK